MKTTKSDLIHTIRVINRRLEGFGYNRRLSLEYRGSLGSNVFWLDMNHTQQGHLFLGKKTGELNQLLRAFWVGLSIGLMELPISN